MRERQTGREGSWPGARHGRARLALAAALAVVLVGCDWTAFGFDAAHTRFNAKDTSISKAAAGELITAWRGATGGGISSSPAVAAGAAYVGSSDGYLYAFDAKAERGCALYRCAPLWRGATGGPVSSSPAVADGMVFVGSDDGRLYAFEAARCAGTPTTDCVPTWVGVTQGPVASSPAVVNGVVYVGSGDGRLYAYRAAGCGGAVGGACGALWRAFTSAPVSSSPAVANGVVYVGSENGRLYAFDASGCAGSPATACTELWRGVTSGPVTSSPAVANGRVYVGSDDAHFYAFDSAGCPGAPGAACSPLWRAVTDGPVSSSPAVANGVAYVGSADGKLYAFDAAGSIGCSGSPSVCAPRWVGVTGGPVSSSPAVANGVVYVGSADQRLYGFATTGPIGCPGTPATCGPVLVGPVGGAVTSSPAVANGVVYVGTAAGSLVSKRAVIDPISPSMHSAVVTPERTDTYNLSVAGSSVTARATGTNTGLDTRTGFVRKADRAWGDQQSCATWSGQSAEVNQQGAVLRVRELANGNRRGILVTKNVWFNAGWIFNVHVWDTGSPHVYTQIASFDLAGVFRPNGQLVPLPWSLCARVVGNVVSLIAWPASAPRPPWEDTAHGGSVALPAGWTAPGVAGWYIGHLRPGDAATFTTLVAGPVAPEENAAAGFGPAATSPPRAPTANRAQP